MRSGWVNPVPSFTGIGDPLQLYTVSREQVTLGTRGTKPVMYLVLRLFVLYYTTRYQDGNRRLQSTIAVPPLEAKRLSCVNPQLSLGPRARPCSMCARMQRTGRGRGPVGGLARAARGGHRWRPPPGPSSWYGDECRPQTGPGRAVRGCKASWQHGGLAVCLPGEMVIARRKLQSKTCCFRQPAVRCGRWRRCSRAALGQQFRAPVQQVAGCLP